MWKFQRGRLSALLLLGKSAESKSAIIHICPIPRASLEVEKVWRAVRTRSLLGDGKLITGFQPQREHRVPPSLMRAVQVEVGKFAA